MHVSIVYESLFGNTHQIAQAIREGIQSSHPEAEVDCVGVDQADPDRLGPVDLLIVGGPTHMYGMTWSLSRKLGRGSERMSASPGHELDPGAEGPGVRTWLRNLPKTDTHTHAAAFDTRTASPTSGGAAYGIARPLAQPRLRLGRQAERIPHRGRRRRPAARRRSRARPKLGRHPGVTERADRQRPRGRPDLLSGLTGRHGEGVSDERRMEGGTR